MNCQEFRESSIAGALGSSVFEPEYVAHRDSCAACAAFVLRLEAQVRALRSLPRRNAPRDLAGRVVAALYAGHREERVVRFLRSMGRVAAPSELDVRVGDGVAPLRAPEDLDWLVAEDQIDPEESMIRRFTGKVKRRSAPDALAKRVEAVLRTGPARRDRARFLAFRLGLGTVAAAALLLWAGPWSREVLSAGKSVAHYPFEVRRIDSIEQSDADSVTTDMIASFIGSGG